MKKILHLAAVMWFGQLASEAQARYSVVITEIMADPSPVVGLPALEWVEIKNTGTSPVNIQQWRLADAGGQSGPFPAFTLAPDSQLIVCGTSAVSTLSSFGRTLGLTSFPSLDNDGDLLTLRTSTGFTMHAVSYSNEWYRNEAKKDGGWSLEMIDPKNPCGGAANWTASTHPVGGTPGRSNSVNANLRDETGPRLLRAFVPDSSRLVLVFNEPLDSSIAAQLARYRSDGGLQFSQAICIPPLFEQVQLQAASPLERNRIYQVEATGLRDCAGLDQGGNSVVKAGLPEDPRPGEWVINEILFDPRPGAWDFVEALNTGNRVLDAGRLYVAGRNSSGQLTGLKALYNGPFLIFPDDHIVMTENRESLAREYLVAKPEQVLTVRPLPTLPDDEGTVVLVNQSGMVTDEVRYSDDWHFKLLQNRQGISLERLDPLQPGQAAGNWHSAASTAGYATPTARNSQYKRDIDAGVMLAADPPVFSPDNDGRDDIVSIRYQVEEPGYVANLTIYNSGGHPVRLLVRNALLGRIGYWNWDGLDDRGRAIPAGPYVVLAEFFNLEGKRERQKISLVLARYLK